MTTTARTHTFTEIPIIDVAPLLDPEASTRLIRRTAELLGEACREVGFFYIENHGISEEERETAFAEMKRFFDLPVEEKMKLHIGKSSQFRGYVPLCGEVTAERRDWHECVDLQPLARPRTAPESPAGGSETNRHVLDDPGQWPEALPTFGDVMMRSWDRLYRLSGKITEGLALSLGLEPGYFETFAGPDLCSLRMMHYPSFDRGAATEDVESGMGAHFDLGFLALLQQDEVGGLEVRNADGQWIPAPHVPGTLLVNIGEMMQRWTNDLYRATLHRVRLPQGRSRYAMPFFFEPRYETVVVPLPTCCDEKNPARYEPFQFGEYLTQRFSKAYKESQATPEPSR